MLTNTTTTTANASLSFFQETVKRNAAVEPALPGGSFHAIDRANGWRDAASPHAGYGGEFVAGMGATHGKSGCRRLCRLHEAAPGISRSDRHVRSHRQCQPHPGALRQHVRQCHVHGPGEYQQAPQTISVKIQTTGGAISQGILSNLPAQGHIAFTFPGQFAATIGQSGLAEFYTASGTIAVLALNFNPAGSLSTAPAYPEAGPPIIGVVGGGAALFSTFGPVEMQWQPAGFAAGAVLLTLTPNADNSTYSAQINGGATFTNGIFTGNGLSFSASVLQPNATVPPYGYLLEPDSTRYVVSSGSLTFNLGATVISSNVQTGNISGYPQHHRHTLRRWRPSYAIRPDLRAVLRNACTLDSRPRDVGNHASGG